jgi:hypothetical protein
MDPKPNKTKNENDARIPVLQEYLQSFTGTALAGDFIINGIILDRIPVDLEEAKKRIKREMREILSEEIEKIQVLKENQGDTSAAEFSPETPGK